MGRLTHRTSRGSTYFVTTKAWQNTSVFQVHEVAEILIRKLLEYRSKGNYCLHEFVLMPDHLHLLLTPTASTTLEKAMQLIKGGSSHEIHRIRESDSQICQSRSHPSRVQHSSAYNNTPHYLYFIP